MLPVTGRAVNAVPPGENPAPGRPEKARMPGFENDTINGINIPAFMGMLQMYDLKDAQKTVSKAWAVLRLEIESALTELRNRL
jgi:hypothetical protein